VRGAAAIRRYLSRKDAQVWYNQQPLTRLSVDLHRLAS
jgi:hypothetical protein